MARWEVYLYDKLPGGAVRCHVCQWRCRIQPGRFGVCRVRRNEEGTLFALNYGSVSSAAVDPIEKKPLFHFYPATLVFSLGTWGCNFHCRHCQNWGISCVTPWEGGPQGEEIAPAQAVALSQRYGCRGIAWTYNEPGIWFEYTLDSARLAKEHNLYTVYVTNGYLTPEALDMIGPYLDAYRVDVKGFSDRFYRELARVSRWRGILEVAQRAKQKWGMHVEVVTNVIPTLNDDDEQLRGIALWTREALGELTPWHITRFYPQHQLQHLPPTPIATLERDWELGHQAGLKFVYLGNVPGHEHENTLCYACGQRAVLRESYLTNAIGLSNGRCGSCGTDLNFRTNVVQSRR